MVPIETSEKTSETGYFQEIFSGKNGIGSAKKFSMILFSILGMIMIISDMIYRGGQLNYEAFVIVVGVSLGSAGLGILDSRLNDNGNNKR